ncbi:hypothetical protein G6F24_016746 [Rhizopus arrhizus]|nr:hypothetical protein G6F24_016746 [Rhizopus arrhizus]
MRTPGCPFRKCGQAGFDLPTMARFSLSASRRNPWESDHECTPRQRSPRQPAHHQPAHRGHDLRQLRGPGRSGAVQGRGRGQRLGQPGHRTCGYPCVRSGRSRRADPGGGAGGLRRTRCDP